MTNRPNFPLGLSSSFFLTTKRTLEFVSLKCLKMLFVAVRTTFGCFMNVSTFFFRILWTKGKIVFCWTTLIIMHGKYVPVFEMLYNNIGYLNTLILITLIPWAVSSEFGVSNELFTAVKGFSHLVFTSSWKPKHLTLNSKCSKRYKLCTQQSVPLIIIRTFFSQFFGRIIFFQCLIDFLLFIQPVFCCLELCSPILRKMCGIETDVHTGVP